VKKKLEDFLNKLDVSDDIKREITVLNDRIDAYLLCMAASGISSCNMDLLNLTSETPMIIMDMALLKFAPISGSEKGEVRMQYVGRNSYMAAAKYLCRVTTEDEAFRSADKYSGFPEFVIKEMDKVLRIRTVIPMYKGCVEALGFRALDEFINLFVSLLGSVDPEIKKDDPEDHDVEGGEFGEGSNNGNIMDGGGFNGADNPDKRAD